MSTGAKAGIVILVLIVMIALGILIPSQFNDKAVVNNTKENVKNKAEKDEAKQKAKQNLPQNLTDEKFNQKFNEQSQLGENFVRKYYEYRYQEGDRSFKESLNYIDDDYKNEKDLSNDASPTLLKRDIKINSIKPVQSSSDKKKITFKYDVDLTESDSKKGFDSKKAKKDEKYLKKIKTTDTTTNKVIEVTFELENNKIIGLSSNYL